MRPVGAGPATVTVRRVLGADAGAERRSGLALVDAFRPNVEIAAQEHRAAGNGGQLGRHRRLLLRRGLWIRAEGSTCGQVATESPQFRLWLSNCAACRGAARATSSSSGSTLGWTARSRSAPRQRVVSGARPE